MGDGKEGKPTKKRLYKPNVSLHKSFEKEVEQGVYNPTQEEVDQLVLIPHFDNVKFHDFSNFVTEKDIKSKKRKSVPIDLTKEEYNRIRAKAKGLAKVDYARISKKNSFNSNLSDINDIKNVGDVRVIKEAIRKFRKDVENVEKQNQILEEHLRLLDKAKGILVTTAKCSIETIRYEQNLIENYYQQNPNEQQISFPDISYYSRLVSSFA
ncbi:hypothetical protein GPJ56_004490 [Histomonas meleagridis]|uniref:uncharacterized protein n=1 Tax=Histomonas meleagridis TaxID=135588 RepID=UPI00355A3E29|nr:hypothetical protein GPJ56_004490 [Histomonas meleagridis]KAH0801982.1 hypothetical protein GO595_005063 [Histomonas meleagridis]